MRLGCLISVLFLSGFTTSVYAEHVFVKYRGMVNLALFECVDTESSLIHRLCYLKDKSYLVVLLGSTYYHYCRVPSATVAAWIAADSKGTYYSTKIRGRFDCRLGGVPE